MNGDIIHGRYCPACLPQNVSRPMEFWLWTCCVCGRRGVPYGRRTIETSWSESRGGIGERWCSDGCLKAWAHVRPSLLRVDGVLHYDLGAQHATRLRIPSRLVRAPKRNGERQ